MVTIGMQGRFEGIEMTHVLHFEQYGSEPVKRYETTVHTDRFGLSDVILIDGEVTVSNAQGKIAEGVFSGDHGLQDFFFVDHWDGINDKVLRELRDKTEDAISRIYT